MLLLPRPDKMAAMGGERILIALLRYWDFISLGDIASKYERHRVIKIDAQFPCLGVKNNARHTLYDWRRLGA